VYPAYLDENITWHDNDKLSDGSEELSQAFIIGSNGRKIFTKTTDSGAIVLCSFENLF
jgi:hypothetical protein